MSSIKIIKKEAQTTLQEILKFLEEYGYTHVVWDGMKVFVCDNEHKFSREEFKAGSVQSRMMSKWEVILDYLFPGKKFTLLAGDRHKRLFG